MTLLQLQQEAREKVDKLMLGEYEPRTLARRGEIISSLIASAYQAGKDAALHHILLHSKSGHYEEHDISFDYQEVPDRVIQEARNTP